MFSIENKIRTEIFAFAKDGKNSHLHHILELFGYRNDPKNATQKLFELVANTTGHISEKLDKKANLMWISPGHHRDTGQKESEVPSSVIFFRTMREEFRPPGRWPRCKVNNA